MQYQETQLVLRFDHQLRGFAQFRLNCDTKIAQFLT